MEAYRGWSTVLRERAAEAIKLAIKEGVLPDPNTLPCAWCKATSGAKKYHSENCENPLFPGPTAMCVPCYMVHLVGEKNAEFRSNYRLAIHFGYRPPQLQSVREWFDTNQLPEVAMAVKERTEGAHRVRPGSLRANRGGAFKATVEIPTIARRQLALQDYPDEPILTRAPKSNLLGQQEPLSIDTAVQSSA